MHYQRIIVVPTNTDSIMKGIDKIDFLPKIESLGIENKQFNIYVVRTAYRCYNEGV